MPPTRSQNRQKLTEQEGRILYAIQAIEKQEKLSIRQAAEIYDIPRTTLQHRLRGRQTRVELRANSTKLTEIEENSLKQWIISMDIRGSAPRPSMVQEMANLLVATRGTTPTTCKVSHDGLTCVEYRDRISGGYQALQAAKKELSIKDCPKCGIMIEKTFGCNHMTCSTCGAHIYWVCMKKFPERELVYKHMEREHDGIGVRYFPNLV